MRLQNEAGSDSLTAMSDEKTPQIRSEMLENPVFRELMAEGLAIQHRFAAEPIYAKTGRGFLKSEGVEEIRRIKAIKLKNR